MPKKQTQVDLSVPVGTDETAFVELCKAYDLTYAYSDDPRAFRSGKKQSAAINAASHKLPRARAVALYNAHAVDRCLVESERPHWYWQE